MAVKRPPEESPLQPGHPNGDAVHALLVAAAQMGLSLRESQGSVTDLGALLARLSETAVPAGALAPIAWVELHARLRKRLISDEQRSLLDLFLMPDIPIRVSAQAPRAEYSDPGSFEMF